MSPYQVRNGEMVFTSRQSEMVCGTRSSYHRGCDCDKCRRANAEYIRAWRARRRGE